MLRISHYNDADHEVSKPSLEPYERCYHLSKWEEIDPIIKNLLRFQSIREVAQWMYRSDCAFCRACNGMCLHCAKSKTTGHECTDDNWWCGPRETIRVTGSGFADIFSKEWLKGNVSLSGIP